MLHLGASGASALREFARNPDILRRLREAVRTGSSAFGKMPMSGKLGVALVALGIGIATYKGIEEILRGDISEESRYQKLLAYAKKQKIIDQYDNINYRALGESIAMLDVEVRKGFYRELVYYTLVPEDERDGARDSMFDLLPRIFDLSILDIGISAPSDHDIAISDADYEVRRGTGDHVEIVFHKPVFLRDQEAIRTVFAEIGATVDIKHSDQAREHFTQWLDGSFALDAHTIEQTTTALDLDPDDARAYLIELRRIYAGEVGLQLDESGAVMSPA